MGTPGRDILSDARLQLISGNTSVSGRPGLALASVVVELVRQSQLPGELRALRFRRLDLALRVDREARTTSAE